MYQILIAQKKAIVYATITNNEDWLLICPLFTKLHERRYSLQSLNASLISSFIHQLSKAIQPILETEYVFWLIQ